MLNILKTALFATLFAGFVLVYVPLRWILSRSAWVTQPLGWLGLIPLALGTTITLWCMWDFATRGQGTPAPMDPPKQLVTRGLYRYVRNPMYIGAVLILIGWSILFTSRELLVYAGAFAIVAHLFVISYEEWALERKFGDAYVEYKKTVRRWLPKP